MSQFLVAHVAHFLPLGNRRSRLSEQLEYSGIRIEDARGAGLGVLRIFNLPDPAAGEVANSSKSVNHFGGHVRHRPQVDFLLGGGDQ